MGFNTRLAEAVTTMATARVVAAIAAAKAMATKEADASEVTDGVADVSTTTTALTSEGATAVLRELYELCESGDIKEVYSSEEKTIKVFAPSVGVRLFVALSTLSDGAYRVIASLNSDVIEVRLGR